MKRVLFVLSHVACKVSREFCKFWAYSALAAAGAASISLSLMYFTDDWGEATWKNFWVAAVGELSALLLPIVTALYFLLLLVPQTRKTCTAKATGRLSYILCVAIAGALLGVVFIAAIGFKYHGWD